MSKENLHLPAVTEALQLPALLLQGPRPTASTKMSCSSDSSSPAHLLTCSRCYNRPPDIVTIPELQVVTKALQAVNELASITPRSVRRPGAFTLNI